MTENNKKREFNEKKMKEITGKIAGVLAVVDVLDKPSWLDIHGALVALLEFHNQSPNKIIDTDGTGEDEKAVDEVAKQLAADLRAKITADKNQEYRN